MLLARSSRERRQPKNLTDPLPEVTSKINGALSSRRRLAPTGNWNTFYRDESSLIWLITELDAARKG